MSRPASSVVAANQTHHALVKQHDADRLGDDRVDLARLHHVLLDLLVFDHTLHHPDAVAQVRVRLALVRLVDELKSQPASLHHSLKHTIWIFSAMLDASRAMTAFAPA